MADQMKKTDNLSRRQFLKSGGLAAGGLVVAFHLPACNFRGHNHEAPEASWSLNAFVKISADDQITIMVNQAEMGQGVYTALPMLVAEELDANWADIVIELAPLTPQYHHASGMRSTGGSRSVSSSWQPLRNVGAMVRALLVNAAAETWSVDSSSLRTEDGQVIHDASARRSHYGRLAAIAATLPTPEKITLKDPKDFNLIGTDVKRIEGPDKVTGKAQYSLDITLPGMLTAVIAHPTVYGNSVESFNADKALAVAGVIRVKKISSGVAVIAKDFWTAKTARDQLDIEWKEGPAAGLSTTTLEQHYHDLADRPGLVAEDAGQTEIELKKAINLVDSVYQLPYLAHAPMEPLNCIAKVGEKQCELWLGTQAPSKDQIVAARVLGITPEQVSVNSTLMGGGFGRRNNPNQDFVIDAVEVANGEIVPIKTVWTREQEIQGGFYRPMFTHKLSAALDKNGMPTAWRQRLVGQSIMKGTLFEKYAIKNGIDYLSVDGSMNMPYAIPNRRIELHGPEVPMSVLWWRSVSHSHSAFAGECFIDELAHSSGKDPLEFRRRLLAEQPRHLQVLELAAKKAGWGNALTEGRAQGIALRSSFGSYVAQVAEVSVSDTDHVTVHRVICAVDCGIAVNPLNIKAQIEGSIVFGISAALFGEITIEKGRVQQSNFHDYPMLRMNAMPEIEVHIVNSTEQPSGIGEPGVPPIAPAIANALFLLTGKRIRKLPIRL